MKATISFDLDDPDDRISHLRCIKSLDLACALSDILALLRKWEKYEPEGFGVELATKEIREALEDIDLDSLLR